MRILVAPVLVGDRICRIVSPIKSLLEVEEWVGEWWEPSTVTLTMASQALQASETVLAERGVPPQDRIATEPRASDPEIQVLLRPEEPPMVVGERIDASPARRSNGARRRQYSGNSRFRRPRASTPTTSLDRADLRREGSDTEWNGPFRRATDTPRIDRSDPSTS